MKTRISLPAVSLVALAIWLQGSRVSACGENSDCVVGDRIYRIHFPWSADGENEPHSGALIIVHGYRGRAEAAMRNASLRDVATRFGIALVAVAAIGNDWSIPGVPSVDFDSGRNELTYFDAVRRDLADRFGIGPDRLVVAGHSAGGMMVWNLACFRPNDYAAFLPIAGTFWQPLPETCTQPPARLIHIHGRNDSTVPLEGRAVEDARQGNVADAIAMYAKAGAFQVAAPRNLEGLDCDLMIAESGATLGLCLHDGGHDFSADLIETGLELLGFAPVR